MNNIEKLLNLSVEDIKNYKINEFYETSTIYIEEDEYKMNFKVKLEIGNINFTFNVSDIQYPGANGDTTSNSNLTLLLNANEYNYLNEEAREELLKLMFRDEMYIGSDISDNKIKRIIIFYNVFKKVFSKVSLGAYYEKQYKKISENDKG